MSTIEEVTEDLDTAISFATAGIDDYSSSSSSSTSSPLPRTPTTPTTPSRSSSLRYSTPFTVPTRPKLPTFVFLNDKAERLQQSLRGFVRLTSQQELASTVEESLAAVVGLVEYVRVNTGHMSRDNSDVHVIVFRTLKAAATSVADVIQLAKTEFSQDDTTQEGLLRYTESLKTTEENSTARINLLVELVNSVVDSQRAVKILDIAVRDVEMTSRTCQGEKSTETVELSNGSENDEVTGRKYKLVLRNLEEFGLKLREYPNVGVEKRDDFRLQLANKLSEMSMYSSSEKVGCHQL